jgi:cytochrome P450
MSAEMGTRPRARWDGPHANPAQADALYREWRAQGPLLWSDQFFGGAWLVTRYADCEALLRDTTRFSARRTGGWVMADAADRQALTEFQRLFTRALLFVDAPDHARLRLCMQAGFTPAALARLRPHIEAIVNESLDEAERAAQPDLIAALARPLPARVMAELLGLSHHDPALFSVQNSDDLAAFVGSAQPTDSLARRAQRALLRMAEAFEQVIAERQSLPDGGHDDLLGRLLQAQAEGRIESHAELLAQMVMLLFAGHETTRHLLGCALLRLAQRPSLWRELHAQPEGVPLFVREVLRLDAPVQYTGRRVMADTEWLGQTLRKGELVLAMIGCANQDEARFAEAQRFDPNRQQGSSLAFGFGPHVCVGAALTQMEADIALRQVLRRWPQPPMLLSGPPDWIQDPLYRGLRCLPLQQSLDLALAD